MHHVDAFGELIRCCCLSSQVTTSQVLRKPVKEWTHDELVEVFNQTLNDKFPRVVTWLGLKTKIDGEDLAASSASAKDLIDFFDGVEPPVNIREARVIIKRLSKAISGTNSVCHCCLNGSSLLTKMFCLIVLQSIVV